MKKNLFFTFCFSFIPGAGQMYQNYMKRGLSLMCIAGIAFILATMLETVIFLIPFLIIMAYSFFDTYNIRNAIGTENEIKDNYILEVNGVDFDKIKGNRLLGVGILLVGIYLLINNVLYNMVRYSEIDFLVDFIRTIRMYFPSLIVSAITIGIGIKMISKK
ncbi:MAG: hypothetical protein HFJ60_03425 [Clostridia bacterium]|nr:hypothetical protein [Clostridia bacterium]